MIAESKKERLIFHIAMEVFITVSMLCEGNYWAASGWGFLMFTNIGTLLDIISQEKEAKEQSDKENASNK